MTIERTLKTVPALFTDLRDDRQRWHRYAVRAFGRRGVRVANSVHRAAITRLERHVVGSP